MSALARPGSLEPEIVVIVGVVVVVVVETLRTRWD